MTIKALFLGTPDFAVPSLEALIGSRDVSVCGVFTQPDRPAGRGGKLQASPVKMIASNHGIPVFQPVSLRKELDAVLKHLEPLGPIDIAVVVAFGQILPRAILDYPRHGCLNVHASLLPRWRGAAPIQRAIMNGDHESGVCLMQMDEGLDTGPVFSRASIAITPTTTGGELHDRLAKMGADLLARDLHSIISGETTPISQSEEGVTYASKITPADCEIDWSQSASQVVRVVHALCPFPGAFTCWRGKRLKIFGAREVDLMGDARLRGEVSPGEIPPGEILVCHEDRLVIACGRGAILVEDLQLEGKRRMSTAELLRGCSFSQGDILEAALTRP